MYELTPQERTQSAHENVATLDVKDLIYIMPPDDHQHFRQRAAAGHDVYAYKIELPPSGATIAFNVWDTDIRIPYANIPARWTITTIVPQEQYRYVVTFCNITGELVHISKYIYPPIGKAESQDESERTERVNRHILSYLQHLKVFGGQPLDDIK